MKLENSSPAGVRVLENAVDLESWARNGFLFFVAVDFLWTRGFNLVLKL